MYIGRVAVAAAAIGLVLTGAPAPATAAPAGTASLDEIYTKLGIDQVASDYVVMVDVSGSMRGPRYGQLRGSLTRFFAALAPEDRVTLIPFAEKAPATTRQVGRAPAQLLAGLPKDADGAYTDIGAALESAVGVLARPGAPALATVVLLTDGQHDPGPNSAYPLTSGHNWDTLTGRARKLHKTSLQAYAVPLSGATGAALLKKVFPGASVLAPTSVDSLTATLAKPKDAARAAKARSILAAEVAQPVRVTWATGSTGAGRSVVDVRLTSPMPHVPLMLDQIAVHSDNPRLTASTGAGPLTLPPGGTVTVPVTVTWDAGPRTAAPLKNVHDRAQLTLSAQIGSPWSAALGSGLGLTLKSDLAAAPADRELSAQRGSLWLWIAGLVLLTALIVLGLRWRRGRLRPKLTGSVRIDRTGSEPCTLPLAGHRVQLDAGATGLPGSGEITAARSGLGSGDVQLLITYSPDGSGGSREAGACAPGQTVSVGGTSFTWQAAVPAQRSGATAAVR